MATIGSRIKEARKHIGLSQTDLADKVDISKQTLYKYENDIITNIPYDKLEAIARVTGVLPSYLLGWEDNPGFIVQGVRLIEKKRLPILGNIACGEAIYADQDWEGYVDVDADINADFCLRAKGDSMTGDRIYDGDIVFIRSQPTVNNGDIAAVLIGDEATLKRVNYDREAGILQLFPSNPKHRIQIYSGEELADIRILGKAVLCQFTLEH